MSSDQRRLAALWASFRREMIPEAAPESQVNDMEFAFYAGALGFYRATTESIAPVGTVTAGEHESMSKALQGVKDEIAAYMRRFVPEMRH